MTNKDYKRLTVWSEEVQNTCMSADSSYERRDDIVARHIDRLYELENAIENGTLVFLPCKVGDEFWWILHKMDGGFALMEEEAQAIEITEWGISIIDMDGTTWYQGEVYFTHEAAEKALEEMKK